MQPITTRLVRQLTDELTQADVEAASGGGGGSDELLADTGQPILADTGQPILVQ
ncbi:hypothetical protein [Azospirillum sp.]|uniref:hypothetical protein n=1 Tax=Azospirillum sp. TaxID=34012 RepID=UPI002D4D1F4D|nr:hypothetical protein [Azospirillum sp.]HYD66183.1 hypothetical protein [Azospirillum sp.]